MTERDHRRVRLAFEPNRFAAEQLVEIYEQLKPMESRMKPTRPVAKAAKKKPVSAKGGES